MIHTIQITVEVSRIGTKGITVSEAQLTVPADISANDLARQFQDGELVVQYSIIEAPADFLQRIESEAKMLRQQRIDTWNSHAVNVLPKIIADLQIESANRGGNWGTRAILNASASLEIAKRCLKSHIPFTVGSEKKVSYETWMRVWKLADRDTQLPLGI